MDNKDTVELLNVCMLILVVLSLVAVIATRKDYQQALKIYCRGEFADNYALQIECENKNLIDNLISKYRSNND